MNASDKMRKELGIVMPAFNEEKNIEKTLSGLLTAAEGFGIDLEIVVVNDGSSDNTGKIVSDLTKNDSRIIFAEHKTNKGFGEAVRTGISRSRKERLLLVPADGQFNPDEIKMFLYALDEYDMVIGVRSARSGYSLFRQFVSFMYIGMVKVLFGVSYRDTNWVQAWRRKIFKIVKPDSKGVFFLQETITRANRAGYKVGEVASEHLDRKDGEAQGGKLNVILFTLFEMLKFRFRPMS